MGSQEVSSGRVRFGLFEADLRAGELYRSGVKVRIQELPFRALSLLIARPDEVINREELRHVLWPSDVFVDFDQGISSTIRRLREALGDSADNPIFIETVERRGYRWIAPIHLPEPALAADQPQKEEEGQSKSLVPTPQTARPFPWQRLVFALPILALLLALWNFLPAYRNAKAVAKSGSRVSGGGPHRAANREAEDYYLKGRFYWNKRTPESLNLALDSFTQAIVHDPTYSDAYVGLADCYNLLREYTMMPASEAYPRAFAAAKKAVELDDHSSQAHASLAFVSFWGMWDAGTADEEFRRALDLDPNNALAHHWYAPVLGAMGRSDESINQIERAQALDPNSVSILADKGRLLWGAERQQEALHLLRQLEQSDPDFVSPHRYLRFAYLDIGDDANYLSETKKEAVLVHDASLAAIAEAAEKGFAAHGPKGMLEAQLEQEKKLYAQGKFSPYSVAETYSRLGNTQQALKYLEASYDQHAENTLSAAREPAFKNLHSNPEFKQFIAKVGLPPVN